MSDEQERLMNKYHVFCYDKHGESDGDKAFERQEDAEAFVSNYLSVCENRTARVILGRELLLVPKEVTTKYSIEETSYEGR